MDDDLSSLFICEDYGLSEYIFALENCDEFTIKLLGSRQSSTDHDLTGQIVWPASIQLCYYLLNNLRNVIDIKDKFNIIELGAGCGLAGFVASFLTTNNVYITDGNEVVLRLLTKNQEYINNSNVIIHSLRWGLKDAVVSFYNKYFDYNSSDHKYKNIIIGADVILWPNEIESLLLTIKLLLCSNKDSLCIISYITRARTTTELLYNEIKKQNMEIEFIASDKYLPSPQPSNLCNLEKNIFLIKLIDPNNNILYNTCENDRSDYIDKNSSAC